MAVIPDIPASTGGCSSPPAARSQVVPLHARVYLDSVSSHRASCPPWKGSTLTNSGGGPYGIIDFRTSRWSRSRGTVTACRCSDDPAVSQFRGRRRPSSSSSSSAPVAPCPGQPTRRQRTCSPRRHHAPLDAAGLLVSSISSDPDATGASGSRSRWNQLQFASRSGAASGPPLFASPRPATPGRPLVFRFSHGLRTSP